MRGVIACLVSMCCGLSVWTAAADVVFNGDIQYRLEHNYYRKNANKASYYTSGDYTNKYAWNLFIKANPTDKLLLGVRFCNPMGYNMDVITDNNKTLLSNPLSVAEFYLKWSPAAFFSVSAGIIPVTETTVRDLTIFEPNGYLNPNGFIAIGQSPWAVYMNNSLKGVDLAFAIASSKQFSIGADCIYAIASEYTPPKEDTTTALMAELGKNQYRVFLSVPMDFMDKMISARPEFSMRANVYRSADAAKADHSYSGGLDVGAKPVKELGLKAGFAYGGYSNAAVADAPTHPDTMPTGMQINAGGSYALPFMSVLLDYSFGMRGDDKAVTKVAQFLSFWDLKFPIPITRVTLIPRVRAWLYTNDQNDRMKIWVRPEINLKAGF